MRTTAQLLLATAVTVVTVVCPVMSRAPALRDQVLLNGTWDNGRVVPEPSWERRWDVDNLTYSRSVTVPSEWSGKTLRLEFERVNLLADISVNGSVVARQEVPYAPLSFTLPATVTAGSTFTLRVATRNLGDSRLYDANGKPLWALSGWGEGGILGDVWLRAYGTVCVDDAYIVTSVRNHRITVEYTLVNNGTQARTVTVAGSIAAEQGGGTGPSLTSSAVSLAAGETKTVTASADWNTPMLWQPGSPHLYLLTSQVRENTTVLDRQTQRFGFREVWIAGNQYMLNGTRMNLRGNSTNWHWPMYYDNEDAYLEDKFPSFVQKNRDLNCNMIRFHTDPGLDYMLDHCDETGMLVMDQSALSSGKDIDPDNGILDNLNNRQVPPWIRSHRNRACLVVWCAENEGYLDGWGNFTPAQLRTIGTAIRQYDRTRPLVYDGDYTVADSTVTYHYIEGYANTVSGSIYSWANRVNASKPTGVGEFLTCYGSSISDVNVDNIWWQGTWSRGLRYVNFADIRPYTFEWTYGLVPTYGWGGSGPFPLSYPEAKQNLVKSYAPVALFDKAYDDRGIAPLKDRTYPSVSAGSTLNRTLVLYNDEFSDTVVTIEVLVVSGTTEYARGARIFDTPLGSHRDIPCSFVAPMVGGATFDLVLRTTKGGTQRFEERYRFAVTGSSSGNTSSAVTITGGRPVDQTGLRPSHGDARMRIGGQRSVDGYALDGQKVRSCGAGRSAAQVVVRCTRGVAMRTILSVEGASR